METTTLFIVVIALAIEFLAFYLIIKAATKSKELLENSNMQLNIAVQTALKNGIDKSLLQNEIEKLDTAQFLAQRAMFTNGKITPDEYEIIKAVFEGKYPKMAAMWR